MSKFKVGIKVSKSLVDDINIISKIFNLDFSETVSFLLFVGVRHLMYGESIDSIID